MAFLMLTKQLVLGSAVRAVCMWWHSAFLASGINMFSSQNRSFVKTQISAIGFKGFYGEQKNREGSLERKKDASGKTKESLN